MENILLAEDQNLAISLTEDQESVPDKLAKIVLLKPFSEFYPAPNYRTYSMQDRGCRYIQTNTEERRAQVEAELRHEQKKLSDSKPELQAARTQLEESSRVLKECEKQNLVLMRKHRDLDEKIKELQNYEYPVGNEAELLAKDLEELRKKLTDIDPAIEDERLAGENTRKKIQLFNEALEQLKGKKRTVEREIQQLQATMDEERNRLYELASNTKAREAKIARLKTQAATAESEYKVELTKYNEAKKAATATGPRPTNSNRGKADVQKDIDLKEARIKQLSSSKENVGELGVRIKLLKEEQSSIQAVINNLSGTLKLLYETRTERYQQISQMKKTMAHKVRHKFNQILKIRSFRGTIEFDWQQRELRLKIIPRGQDECETNTKSLSGGERSFSTVALLISLWYCIDHPFYFLDEYDVFTDQVNRYVMTKLLIHAAEEKKDQFSFLTPQDMSQFQAKPNLTIHKFADPIRWIGNHATQLTFIPYHFHFFHSL